MKHVVKQSKQMLGIMDAVITHVVEKTEAVIDWTGPKISPEQWTEMLAFFKHTHATAHSESQVRLYVNKDRWAIWAMPQKANTSMTALELDTPEAVEQRALFLESEGWLYFGTVHHHCGMTAFQSSTDAENERLIDGLHITIGKMDENPHDMHVRLLLMKQVFTVNMSWFWDIGEQIRQLLPESMHDQVARYQMCRPAPITANFPKQWLDNYIEVKPAVEIVRSNGSGVTYYGTRYNMDPGDKDPRSDCKLAEWKLKKIDRVVEHFESGMELANIDPATTNWWELVEEFDEEENLFGYLVKRMCAEDVMWEDVVAYAAYCKNKEEQKQEEELRKEEEAAEKEEQERMLDGMTPDEREQFLELQRELKVKAEPEQKKQPVSINDLTQAEIDEAYGGGY